MNRFRMTVPAALLAGTVLAPLGAQDVPTFEVSTHVVHLTVSVSDPKTKQFVTDLSRSDFRLLENGYPQDVVFFHQEELPVCAVLMIDMSGSTQPYTEEIRVAARRFIDSLGPKDMASVVMFNRRPVIVQDFTSDHTELYAAVEREIERNETSLYTAVYVTLRDLHAIEAPEAMEFRKTLVFLTDGIDTTSYVTAEQVLEAARAADVTVYPVIVPLSGMDSLGAPRDSWSAQQFEMYAFLRDIARDTGGRLFEPPEMRQLGVTYANIAREVSVLYGLAYQTDRPLDGSYRYITVQLPKRPGLNLRHRTGYRAVTH